MPIKLRTLVTLALVLMVATMTVAFGYWCWMRPTDEMVSYPQVRPETRLSFVPIPGPEFRNRIGLTWHGSVVTFCQFMSCVAVLYVLFRLTTLPWRILVRLNEERNPFPSDITDHFGNPLAKDLVFFSPPRTELIGTLRTASSTLSAGRRDMSKRQTVTNVLSAFLQGAICGGLIVYFLPVTHWSAVIAIPVAAIIIMVASRPLGDNHHSCSYVGDEGASFHECTGANGRVNRVGRQLRFSFGANFRLMDDLKEMSSQCGFLHVFYVSEEPEVDPWSGEPEVDTQGEHPSHGVPVPCDTAYSFVWYNGVRSQKTFQISGRIPAGVRPEDHPRYAWARSVENGWSAYVFEYLSHFFDRTLDMFNEAGLREPFLFFDTRRPGIPSIAIGLNPTCISLSSQLGSIEINTSAIAVIDYRNSVLRLTMKPDTTHATFTRSTDAEEVKALNEFFFHGGDTAQADYTGITNRQVFERFSVRFFSRPKGSEDERQS